MSGGLFLYNNKYEELVSKWTKIIEKLERNNITFRPFEFGEKATLQEIMEKEKELGFRLPPSYRHVVQNFTKSFSFSYNFSDNIIVPEEFAEIASGEVYWDSSNLTNLNQLADHLMEDGIDYGYNLRNKLEFSHSCNGDIYAFDMAVEGEEKPVVYWDHEVDTITYLADSFIDYLEKITELNCIGSGKWQFEYFLTEHGLDTSGVKAMNWKKWFDTFSETRLEDVEHNLDELISFMIYRKELDSKALQALLVFDNEELFQKLLSRLKVSHTFNQQRKICEIIGESLGTYVEDWVKGLWEDDNSIDPRLRSYLSAKCIGQNQGLKLVLNYLEKKAQGKVSGIEARAHLHSFHAEKVIQWMESHVNFPVTPGWNQLFIEVGPTWGDVVRWSTLDERHEVTVIHGLESFIHNQSMNSEDIKMDKPLDLPPKEEFESFLRQLLDRQLLRKRKIIIEKLLLHINLFY